MSTLDDMGRPAAGGRERCDGIRYRSRQTWDFSRRPNTIKVKVTYGTITFIWSYNFLFRIYDVSITTVAKSSFEDAVKFSIDTKGTLLHKIKLLFLA